MILKRLTVLLLLLAISSSVHAQRFNQKRVYEGMRDGTWEATLMIGSQGSLDAEGQNGSGVSIDSEIAWGFSIGWNWTERWNFNYRFTLAKPDYTATIVPQDPDIPNQTLDYSADRYANQLNAIWHWFKGPLTPYLQAGIGYTKLDSNVPSRPPDIDCWWDPWWGYICFEDWSTYDTSGFSYNLGLGLRWDVNEALFFKGSWNRDFYSADNADLDFDTVMLEAGLMW